MRSRQGWTSGGPREGVIDPVSTPPTQPPRPSVEGPASFALAPALRARLLGTGLVAIGTVVLIGMLLTWLADLPTACRLRPGGARARRGGRAGPPGRAYATGCCGWTSTATASGVCGLPRRGRRGGPMCSTCRQPPWPASGASYSASATGVRRHCRSTRSRAARPRSSRRSPSTSTAATGTAACAEPTGPTICRGLPIFRGDRGWVTCGLLLGRCRLVAYGARLLSGLRVEPSRGFKSRHLRRPTAPDPRGFGAVAVIAKTCMIVQCTVMSSANLLTGVSARAR